MSYYKRVVKRRSACMTDEEIAELRARAREHALDIAKANAVWKEPVLPVRVLCWWCRSYHSPAEVEKCMSLPERRATAEPSALSTSNSLAAGLLSQYSELWAFLTQTSYPDGRRRQTGRLSLSCESSGLRMSLTDEQTGLYASLTSRSLDDLLLAIETGMAANDLPWRESKYSPGKNGKK